MIFKLSGGKEITPQGRELAENLTIRTSNGIIFYVK